MAVAPVRLIAFYLPQYHPIPENDQENDQWWGTSFTEWTNVVKARPLFRTHYQPHLPADLGFYDLRVPEVNGMLERPTPAHTCFLGVMPSWDNTPRRHKNANILHGSTPERYEGWLRTVIRRTHERHSSDERIIFVNAWNEWAEGCHLEPDQWWGHSYLRATRRPLEVERDPEVGLIPSAVGAAPRPGVPS
jgi:lipopolysaccharide biosynthesis protein